MSAAKLIAAAVLAVSVPAAPAAAAERIAAYRTPVQLAANRDTVAWSAYDAAAGEFRLMLSERGVVRPAPVPPRRLPFDVDAGRGPDGATLVTYSRCADEAMAPDGSVDDIGRCELRVFDIAEDRERAIPVRGGPSAIEGEPVVWGGRVVFNVSDGIGFDVYAVPLRGGRARRLRIHGRGEGSVLGKDLLGRRLAVVLGRGDRQEVWVQRLDGSRPRRVARVTLGEAGNSFVGLGFDRGTLGFARVCELEEACRGGAAYRFRSGRLETARVPASLTDFALARGQAFWVDAPADGCAGPQGGDPPGCFVERAGTLPFSAARGARRRTTPRPAPAPGAGPGTR